MAATKFSRAKALPLLVLTAIGSAGAACGDDNKPPELPEVEKILRWLPQDTETIVVGKAFKIEAIHDHKKRDPSKVSWEYLQKLSLGDLPHLEESAGLEYLVGRGVAVAVNAGRDFEVVSSFGSLRYHGCSLIRLQEPLPEKGHALIEALRGSAKEIRKVAGTEVFVFPDRTVMESTRKPKAWQGQFIAITAPDILLCATSDVFLSEVLDRVNARNPASADRALPADLPEWKHVDMAASVWALRHLRTTTPGQSISGLTWRLRPKGRNVFEAAYIPIAGKDAVSLAKVWHKPELNAPALIEENEGVVVVTIDVQKVKLGMWYPMAAYWSMGETGQPAVLK